MQRLFKLKGVVQPYAWGGREFIPALTGIPASGAPAAEYWLGAHPAASAEVLDSQGKVQGSLYEMIREKPQNFLGEKLSGQYETLPFLVKVLDVKQMLSIQVHPTAEGAVQGFEREEMAGIPINASNRNYKDRNGKSEMMIALSDFWLLHGFRADLSEFFSIPEFSPLNKSFETQGYEGLFTTIMRMDQASVNNMLKPLAERVTRLYNNNELSKADPNFWAARALQTYFHDGDIDRGIFSIYLLNLLHLQTGEGIYQPPGVLHAYLEGQNLEVMSNSDNVLRAGLTAKHVDVEEVIAHVDYAPIHPVVLKDHFFTDKSCGDFQCTHVHGKGLTMHESEAPALVFVIDGALDLSTGSESARCSRGEACFVAPGSVLRAEPVENVDYFVVTLPKNPQ